MSETEHIGGAPFESTGAPKKDDVDNRHIERLILITDGIYAISLTLLALEIHLPTGWGGDWHSLFDELTLPLSAYFFSFFVVALSWGQHRQQFALVKRIDNIATALHFASLSFVALMPAAINILIANFNFSGILAYTICTVSLKLFELLFWGYVSLIRNYVDDNISRLYRITKFISNALILAAASSIVFIVAPRAGVKLDVSKLSGLSVSIVAVSAILSLMVRRLSRR